MSNRAPDVLDLASLDDRATVERLDPHGLLGRIDALPEQCEEAWKRARSFVLPAAHAGARAVVVLGMGGSAIAGEILRALAWPSSGKPIAVVRGYDVPAQVGAGTLAIACSHSGNTEETLSAVEHALAAGVQVLAITTGGRLGDIARERGLPLFVYQYDGEPRAALGHQLMVLLAVGESMGLLGPQDAALAEVGQLLREQRARDGFSTPAADNGAKQIAGRLYGRLPIIIAGGVLAPAAYRWKTQINENSKSWATFEELPELGHNTIVGFGLPRQLLPSLHAVFLSSASLDQRLLLSYEAVAEELLRSGVSSEQVDVPGTSALAQVLSAVYLGDFVSYYLALLNGEQPSPVEPIVRFKAKLAGN